MHTILCTPACCSLVERSAISLWSASNFSGRNCAVHGRHADMRARASTAALISGRVISGIGAAFALPMSLVLLTLAYPGREERAHAMGIRASCNGLAFIIGPTFGGWL